MDAPSILIVDDEPNNFDVIEALFINHSYNLHYAASGEQAIASLDVFQPDLILLDVMMPGMDGIEACRRIKAMPQWRSVPIMMVTALTTKEDLARCLQAGADDFISKPVNSLELRARVSSLLRIKQQYDDLQALLKLREDIVQMVVHDLRNPLTSILIGLNMLENLDLPRDRQQTKISQIRTAGQQLQSLIDDLLLIAKIESGKLQLNRTEIDLQPLIAAALSDFEIAATAKHIDLISQLPDENLNINIDASMFRRVLDNLLSNALKFSPSRSQITVYAENLSSEKTKIQIADQGRGIPETLRQSIFERYEVGTLVQNVSQLGLGLAFCKMVVEAHDGEIRAIPNEPKGAIFEIILPR